VRISLPGPVNLIATLNDTMLFDNEWRWDSAYYYKVSPVDIHDNESLHAFLQPQDVTGIGETDC
jgi:hypothetical protein